MTDNISIKWLNSACLGSNGIGEPRSMKNAAEKIIETFESLRSWVTQWTGYVKSQVAFADSTTAACDAAISALNFDCELYIYTSSAHPTIRQSIRNAAHTCGRFRARSPIIREIDLQDLNFSSSEDVAVKVVERIEVTAENRPSLIILEHVTYDHGLRLPINLIVELLAISCPNVKVIIDGAQAVGLWRPLSPNVAAYIGCFHKYIGAPAATAFLIIDGSLVEWLPSHVQATCNISEAISSTTLPTIDLGKWEKTAEVLKTYAAVEDVEERLICNTYFNRELDAALSPYATSLGKNHDPNLRSHISSFVFRSERAAKNAHGIIEQNGFAVQQTRNLIRITAGHQSNPIWAMNVGSLVKSLYDADIDRSAVASV